MKIINTTLSIINEEMSKFCYHYKTEIMKKKTAFGNYINPDLYWRNHGSDETLFLIIFVFKGTEKHREFILVQFSILSIIIIINQHEER